MRIVAQNKSDNMFLVGMTLEEYILQVKPMIDNNQNLSMYSEEDIVRQYKMLLSNEVLLEDIYNYYRSKKIFEVYVAIKRDLSSAFLTIPVYPFHHMWGAYSPYAPFFGSGYIKHISEIKEVKFNPLKIRILIGDIIDEKCGAIVNAANKELQAGGGVCGAIFKKAGYDELQKECNTKSPIKTGEAVITKGYNLNADYIIHAAGPIYKDDSSSIDLFNAYTNSLRVAEENRVYSIAFPSISTGIYGYPVDKASKIAIDAITNFNYKSIGDVRIVCFDDNTFKYYKESYYNSKYFIDYENKIIGLLSKVKDNTSSFLTIRPELGIDKVIDAPSIKVIDRTGEIIFLRKNRLLEMIHIQIPDYNPQLFLDVLKKLESQKKIVTCEGEVFEGDYTTTISILW